VGVSDNMFQPHFSRTEINLAKWDSSEESSQQAE